MNIKIISAAMVVSVLFIGCSKKPSTISTPATNRPVTYSTDVIQFLATDWSARPLFPAGSMLNLTESQFKTNVIAAEKTNGAPVTISEVEMSPLTDLKMSAVAVLKTGDQAEANGDMAQARECFMSVKQCGEALDSTNCLDLVRLVGKAFEKKASAELAKIGS